MIAGSNISVVEGQNGWLFLESFGEQRTLDNARDLSGWRTQILPQLKANYLARYRRVVERGIPFLLVLAPEAHGIYPEQLPAGRSVELPTAAEILAEELRSEGVDVVLPSREMRESKGPIDLYVRVDSHWSYYGAYICYMQIVSALKGKLHIKPVEWRDIHFGVRNGFGDLGVHMRPERKAPLQTISISGYEVTSAGTIYDERERNLRQSTCATGVGKALLFRDSYAATLSPFLERTFAQTTLIAPAPTMLDSAIDFYQPDVVILEVAERSLFSREAAFGDWDPRTVLQSYSEQASNQIGGKMQVQAVAALREGRPMDAIPGLAVAIAMEGEHARVHNLAWALLNAGKSELCLILTRHFAPALNDGFLYYLLAASADTCGQDEEALVSIDRAIALQPTNAMYLYSKAEWLFRRQCYGDSAAAALLSIRYAPLHKRSWAVCCASLRSVGQADRANQYSLEAEAIFGAGQIERSMAESW